MKLRDDPVASSAMAAVLAQSNSFQLTGKIGRRPTDSELYMAHFMGVGGAAKLISSAEDNPQASGAALFPGAAAANRSIFYDRSGSARSVSEIYSVLNARYAGAANSPATRTALAAFGASPSAATGPGTSVVKPAFLSSFPDVGSVTTTAPAATTADSSAPAEPMFRSLFQVGDRTQPVSPAIHELWGNSSSLTSVASASSVAPATSVAPAITDAAATSVASAGSVAPVTSAQASGTAQPLDLFSDRSGRFSS
jgi:hypothetical protein